MRGYPVRFRKKIKKKKPTWHAQKSLKHWSKKSEREKNLKEVISGTSLVKLDNNVENLLNGVNDVANLKLGGK